MCISHVLSELLLFFFTSKNKCFLYISASKHLAYLASKLNHHHDNVLEALGVFSVPWSSRWIWSLHLFLGPPLFLRLLVYIVAFVLVFYLCPSSVRVLATFPGTVLFPLLRSVLPFFLLMHWFFSLSSFVIPSKCLKNFIYAASKRFSSFFFSALASLPNFNPALAVIFWILNFVSLLICFPKVKQMNKETKLRIHS